MEPSPFAEPGCRGRPDGERDVRHRQVDPVDDRAVLLGSEQAGVALFGVVSAGTALVWATDLYDGYAWWFRLAGLLVLAALVYVSLRRRNQCSIAGVRSLRKRLLAVLAIAVGTYAALYALTTWLGTLA